jgi:hypothetical protein
MMFLDDWLKLLRHLILTAGPRASRRSSIVRLDVQIPGAPGSIFGDPIIATAILDRLLHHSTTINIRGESYRLKDRRKPVCFHEPRRKPGQPPFPPQRCRRTVLAVKGPLRRAKPAALATLPK